MKNIVEISINYQEAYKKFHEWNLNLREDDQFHLILISEEDRNWANNLKIVIDKTGYARIGNNKFLHTEVLHYMGLKLDGFQADHKNGIKWDNRRENLRLATPQQNCFNRKARSDRSSKYKGVLFIKKTGLWHGTFGWEGNCISLGDFQTEDQAAVAYNIFAKEFAGEFACLNKIENEEKILPKVIEYLSLPYMKKRFKGASKIYGVYFHKRIQKWWGKVGFNNKLYYTKYFYNKSDCEKAVQDKLKEIGSDHGMTQLERLKKKIYECKKYAKTY